MILLMSSSTTTRAALRRKKKQDPESDKQAWRSTVILGEKKVTHTHKPTHTLTLRLDCVNTLLH